MVFITSTASYSAFGHNQELTRAIEAKETRFTELSVDVGEYSDRFIVSKAPDPDPPAHILPRLWDRWDRASQFAVVVATNLWDARSFEDSPSLRSKTAVIIGCGITGMATLDPEFHRLYGGGKTSLAPLTIPKAMPSAIASAVADTLALSGPALSISAACSSGIHAMLLAKSMIDAGIVDRAIVGAAEASLQPGPMLAWRALRVLSDEPMRPFSEKTSGINLAEGCALMLLENEQGAKEWTGRKAQIRAVRTTTGGGHLTRPDTRVMVELMEQSLAHADCSPQDVFHLNTHGTGTAANNLCEAEAIEQVFGKCRGFPQVSATKAHHGHLLAASAALETVLVLEMIRSGRSIPALNQPSIDDAAFPCHRQESQADARVFMKTAYGFGGTNGCLIVELEPG